MEKKYQDMLRDMLKDVLSEQEKEKAKELDERNKELETKALEDNKELKAKLESLEKMVGKKVDLSDPTNGEKKTFIYKGYDIRKQAHSLGLPEEQREMYAKEILNAVHYARNKAAYAEGTGSTGGYMVNDEFASTIMAQARLSSVAMTDCEIIPMGGDKLYIPVDGGTAPSVYWKDEAAQLTDGEGNVGQVELSAEKLTWLGTMSNELLADADYDIVGHITERVAEAVGQELDDEVFNGGTFSGILSGASVNYVDCAASGSSPSRHVQLTNDEMAEAIYTLPSNRIMGARFYLHRNSAYQLSILEDTAGNPIFSQRNGIDLVHGYPFKLVEKLPSAPAADSGFAVFGNLRNYILGRRKGGIMLDFDPYGKFDYDQTRMRVVTRWAGAFKYQNAFVVIETHA